MSARDPSQTAWRRVAGGVAGDHHEITLPVCLLFLFAHPDDESIAASMLLSYSEKPRLVYLTDGAPRDRRLWSPEATGLRAEYASLRHQEAVDAVQFTGIGEGAITWLGAVDQEAIDVCDSLTARTAELILRHRPDAVVTHAYEGGHPDHDAAALVACLALQAAAEQGVHCELLEVPLYHGQNGHFVPGRFLEPSQADDAHREEVALPLRPQDLERKRQMLSRHRSQRRVLESFPLTCERVRPAPLYDFTKPPHAGKLWYESLGWSMTGRRWRELAALTSVQG
jgi:LmbE family N-acetylglucosaminyl deacetylase